MVRIRIDIDYPLAPWYETYDLIERLTEQEQQAVNEWTVGERARLLPGRKVIEQKGPRRYLITVAPKGDTLVSWISNEPAKQE